MEREMYMECRDEQDKPQVWSLGDERCGASQAREVGRTSREDSDASSRGLLVVWSIWGALVHFQKCSWIYNQEKWVRRQCKWEAQENNSLGGFPGRRKRQEHWDLANGPAGTSKTLGGGGQGRDLPLLMEEGGGRDTLLPTARYPAMGLTPGPDPAQVAQTQSHKPSFQGEAGGGSTQDSMKVTEEALFSVPSSA